MNTSQIQSTFLCSYSQFLQLFKEATALVFCSVKVFEGRALLLVINGRGSVKEYAPPQYRVSCLYGEGGVNLYWSVG